MMKGWKTWLGIALIAISAGLRAAGYEELSNIVLTVGGAIGVVGIGHKIEKTIK